MGACLKNRYGNSCDYRIYHFKHPEQDESRKSNLRVSTASRQVGTYGQGPLTETVSPERQADTWSPSYRAP